MGILAQIKECFKRGGKLLVCGNGGSSAETDHFVSEFVTHGFPAISLCNVATITAIANDYDFSEIFSRQVRVLGKKGDILIGLSTSGKSKNILKAYKEAKRMGIEVIDWPRPYPSRTQSEVAENQEYQLGLMHLVYLKLI
jgi:D-sedoheptulose 7-phosphate isomerase